jgi:transposase
MRRAENAAWAAELKAQGLNGIQIAQRMGISRSYAYELLADPEGHGARARKDSYRGTCERCGAPTNGNDGPGSAATICVHCRGPEISARQAEAHRAERDKLAELYLSGMPYKEIAAAMGWRCCSLDSACSTVQNYVARLRSYGYDLPYRYAMRDGKRVAA